MESSNTSELVSDSTNTEVASPVEQSQPVESQGAAETVEGTKPEGGEKSFVDKVKERVAAHKAENKAAAASAQPTEKPPVVEAEAATPPKPAYEPNYKYKAFGKERELDPAFRSMITDAESEKKVKDVFTRADAFDEMKSRYESASGEYQKTLGEYKALDNDVRRITNFLNKGDLDNFFASVRLTDQDLLSHLQKKAEIANLSPNHQAAYNNAAELRAAQYHQQEQMNQMQAQFQNQAVMNRTMQLESAMHSPQFSDVARQWDSRMGDGAFRQLVIETGANHYHQTGEDISPAQAAQMVMQKWGRMLEQPQAQSVAVPAVAQSQAAASQTHPTVQAKPVIPAVAGRGATPIQQRPKSIDDLKRLGKEALKRERQEQEQE